MRFIVYQKKLVGQPIAKMGRNGGQNNVFRLDNRHQTAIIFRKSDNLNVKVALPLLIKHRFLNRAHLGRAERRCGVFAVSKCEYQKIQQTLIDVLDTADYVEVTGKGDNCTDMRVNLAELTDPATQTRFENCVADVNIPVGEVFTSPKLTGTRGILNVSSVYVGEIQFKNLTMKFEDGRVTEVSCDNFLETLPKDADEAMIEEAKSAGKRLVVQEIMNQHESLPLGEFAIGTNTTAYAMAEKYQIIDRLPILIVEKNGSSFCRG